MPHNHNELRQGGLTATKILSMKVKRMINDWDRGKTNRQSYAMKVISMVEKISW